MGRNFPKTLSYFLLILVLLFHIIKSDELSVNQSLSDKDGDILISSGGKFELGFFSPGNSRNRYLGIWFRNIPEVTVLWVANRDTPLADTSGVLKVIQPGILAIVNATNITIWSSNTSRSVENPVAELLDSGNLVVKDSNDESAEIFLWQSFEYPTDTYLPGMNLGWNFITGKETYLTSWMSNDDPGTGQYSLHLDPTGYPQFVVRRGGQVQSRIGPWNGLRFPGPPSTGEDPTYMLSFVMNKTSVYYTSDLVNRSFISRYVMNLSGITQRWTWVDRTRGWTIYVNIPSDNCDTYRLCGAYGNCNIGMSPSCECLNRFVPSDSEGWVRGDWSNGCVRRANLSCQGDVFLRYSGIKQPDARNTWYNANMTLAQCEQECLRNCSCTAYAQLDVRTRSGCLIWFGELVDIRTLSTDGQVIYIRMASSEAAGSESRGRRREILIGSLVSAMAVLVLGLCICLFIRKRKINSVKLKKEAEEHIRYDNVESSDLPFLDLSVILKATNDFAMSNKLGEGGFGFVYKGILEGQEVAVKRLSKESTQGLTELRNEAIFIAKLQHRNLVKLLGCCIQGNEGMLVYEYMPNKSLDNILFDKSKSASLDWEKRFNIINGIARGLLYLHQDSRLRIIHRDLKASNILLDRDMNPKISDFGLARSFLGNEAEAQTRRVVGTYGYMSPEYAMDGLFSTKSDVFSFGVLVLEIIRGRRNRGVFNPELHLNLLGHAWTLHREGRPLELVDEALQNQFHSSEVVRSIQVGLLCVQQNPEDRPAMSSVVLMLGNEGDIPQAKQPGFFMQREGLASQSSTSSIAVTAVTNELTITTLEPR